MNLKHVTSEDRTYLFNVLQKYLYELSAYYQDEPDKEGNIAYDWFDSYFEDDPEREAFLLVEGAKTVGFLLINTFSDLDEDIDHAVAELTIYPPFRSRGLATKAVRELFSSRPGRWELTYQNSNDAAATFWGHMTRPYAPELTQINPGETILSFEVRGL